MARESRLPDAQGVLTLLAQHAPPDVRDMFAAALRARGLRERWDRAGGDRLVYAWVRPDIYAQVFAAGVLPALGPAEHAAAVEALGVLSAESEWHQREPGGATRPA